MNARILIARITHDLLLALELHELNISLRPGSCASLLLRPPAELDGEPKEARCATERFAKGTRCEDRSYRAAAFPAATRIQTARSDSPKTTEAEI